MCDLGPVLVSLCQAPMYIMFISHWWLSTLKPAMCSEQTKSYSKTAIRGDGVNRCHEYSKLSIYKKGTWISSHFMYEVNS